MKINEMASYWRTGGKSNREFPQRETGDPRMEPEIIADNTVGMFNAMVRVDTASVLPAFVIRIGGKSV